MLENRKKAYVSPYSHVFDSDQLLTTTRFSGFSTNGDNRTKM